MPKYKIIDAKNKGNVHLRSHVDVRIEMTPGWPKIQKYYALDLLVKEAEKLGLRMVFDPNE